MERIVTLVAATLLIGAASAVPGRVATGGPAESAQPLERFRSLPGAGLATDGGRGATNLRARPGCSRSGVGAGEVQLTWTPPEQSASEQRIGLTTHAADFAGGDFAVTAPLAPDRASYVLGRGISPGAIHYWQVLARQPEGWVASEVGTFEGPVCASDPVPTGK